MTNAQLGSWFSASLPTAPADASGVTYIEKVTAGELYYYRVAIGADPTSALSAGTPFAITPSTAQAPYCLTRLLALRSSLTSVGDAALPPGLDWCSTSVNAALTAARDTGQVEVTKLLGRRRGSGARLPDARPAPRPGTPTSRRSSPSTRPSARPWSSWRRCTKGSTPATVAGRANALEGWVGGVFDTSKILADAVAGQSDLQVTLTRVNAGSAARGHRDQRRHHHVGRARRRRPGRCQRAVGRDRPSTARGRFGHRWDQGARPRRGDRPRHLDPVLRAALAPRHPPAGARRGVRAEQ